MPKDPSSTSQISGRRRLVEAEEVEIDGIFLKDFFKVQDLEVGLFSKEGEVITPISKDPRSPAPSDFPKFFPVKDEGKPPFLMVKYLRNLNKEMAKGEENLSILT
eukprot:CAMPEP_0170559518 /NCGR_PEP_ID=MMETSP0211-20121228/43324_1 /TAXON_ID=311385 /ORGANISM="Pseudokeronopsis sp., Strain OXSARD2" /LENGTH=104 /DNA_ID=CAMNT_0010872623 /DNA_START=58 /DNA_END=374 /DNA_ORIENTATION=+